MEHPQKSHPLNIWEHPLKSHPLKIWEDSSGNKRDNTTVITK